MTPDCEWEDDLPGEPCGTDDQPAPAVATRTIAWSTRIWGGEGEDWTEETSLCQPHADALDAARAKRTAGLPVASSVGGRSRDDRAA